MLTRRVPRLAGKFRRSRLGEGYPRLAGQRLARALQPLKATDPGVGIQVNMSRSSNFGRHIMRSPKTLARRYITALELLLDAFQPYLERIFGTKGSLF
jgi:hypothetical protein